MEYSVYDYNLSLRCHWVLDFALDGSFALHNTLDNHLTADQVEAAAEAGRCAIYPRTKVHRARLRR